MGYSVGWGLGLRGENTTGCGKWSETSDVQQVQDFTQSSADVDTEVPPKYVQAHILRFAIKI